MVDVLRLVGFGWYFGACLGLGVAGGLALDAWLDTKPGFLLGGIVLGTIAGFYGLFKMMMPLYRGRNGGDHRDSGASR
jgi:F0F1-type ATP synthase assembly protein I